MIQKQTLKKIKYIIPYSDSMPKEKSYPITINLTKDHLKTLYKDSTYQEPDCAVIDELTDQDMKKMAKTIAIIYFQHEYWDHLRDYIETNFSYQLYTKEKEFDEKQNDQNTQKVK